MAKLGLRMLKRRPKAGGGIRTRNPRFTKAVLYQLKLRWQTIVYAAYYADYCRFRKLDSFANDTRF